MKPRMTHAIILALAAFGGLFALKYTVEQKEERLAVMKAQYLADQKALRVLKAEWSYLNSPEYLQAMADKYLMLKPVGSKQVVAWFEEVPQRAKLPTVTIALEQDDQARGSAQKVAAISPGGGNDP